MRTFVLLAILTPSLLTAQNIDWPVYGGTTDNTHYSKLSQITPSNVSALQIAWTYETHDEFKGSEMQANPIVVDGVLYATTPNTPIHTNLLSISLPGLERSKLPAFLYLWQPEPTFLRLSGK